MFGTQILELIARFEDDVKGGNLPKRKGWRR